MAWFGCIDCTYTLLLRFTFWGASSKSDYLVIWTHLDGSQLKDPGSNRPDYELDDLVDDMEDAYSKLSDLDQCIPLEELKVTSICLCDKTEVGLGYKSLQTGGFTMCSQKPR